MQGCQLAHCSEGGGGGLGRTDERRSFMPHLKSQSLSVLSVIKLPGHSRSNACTRPAPVSTYVATVHTSRAACAVESQGGHARARETVCSLLAHLPSDCSVRETPSRVDVEQPKRPKQAQDAQKLERWSGVTSVERRQRCDRQDTQNVDGSVPRRDKLHLSLGCRKIQKDCGGLGAVAGQLQAVNASGQLTIAHVEESQYHLYNK